MPKCVLERRGKPVGQFFRGGHHQSHAAKILRRAAAQIDLQERRRRQQKGHGMMLHERADGFGVERIRMKNHADAERRRQPERAGETERMKERQHAQEPVVAVQIKHLVHLLDVRADVEMREHHALRLAGAAAGKNHGGQGVQGFMIYDFRFMI